MNMQKTHSKHEIGPHHSFALRDARGRTVTCLNGSVWLTMEGDRRDIVLDPGAMFVVDRDGLTLLAAQRPSAVQVTAQNQAGRWVDRLMDFLERTYGPVALERNRRWSNYDARNR